MRELHGSPRQRSMIAEISSAFRNDLIAMDARAAFVSGGPARGDVDRPEHVRTPSGRIHGGNRIAVGG